MPALIGIDPNYDFLFDPQQARPAGWCPVCHMEIWEEGQPLCRACTNAARGENPDWEYEDE